MARRYTKRQRSFFAPNVINFDDSKFVTNLFSPTSAIVELAKRKWPGNTPAMLANLVGSSLRMAYHYINGRCEISARGLTTAIASEHGPDVLDFIFAERAPQWWANRADRTRMDTLASGLEALQNEIEELKRRRPT